MGKGLIAHLLSLEYNKQNVFLEVQVLLNYDKPQFWCLQDALSYLEIRSLRTICSYNVL